MVKARVVSNWKSLEKISPFVDFQASCILTRLRLIIEGKILEKSLNRFFDQFREQRKKEEVKVARNIRFDIPRFVIL